MSKQKTKLIVPVIALGLATTALLFFICSLSIKQIAFGFPPNVWRDMNFVWSMVSCVYWLLAGVIWSFRYKEGVEGLVCINCDYSLIGLNTETCPGCGQSNKGRMMSHKIRRRVHTMILFIMLFMGSILIMIVTGFVLGVLMVVFGG